MMQPITILPVSSNALDNLYATIITRHNVNDFFADGTSTVWQHNLSDSIKNERREFLLKIKKIRIIITNYFIGQEREILLILLTSVSPVADIANLTSMCLVEVYRKINYLRRVIIELYNYFEKKTYKQINSILLVYLTPTVYMCFQLCIRTRDVKKISKLMGRKTATIWRMIEKIDDVLKHKTYEFVAIKDLFIVWRRIRKIRKSYYGYYKRELQKDLEM